MKTSVLVTGGAGFIGSHVAKNLLNSGFEVTVVDDLSGGFVENVPTECKFVQGDAGDVNLIYDLFKSGRFKHVFHLGAYAAEGLSHFIRRFNYSNNLISSVNLINASIQFNVETFVFTSSIAVYGKNQLPMTEELTPAPEDPYGISKFAVELDLRAAFEMFGLRYVIFRPHNVYGPHQNLGDPYRNAIGIFMNQVMQGKPITIFGDGSQSRAFSYIDDVAPIIARAIEFPSAIGKVFNVGADQPTTVKNLALEVMKTFKSEVPIEFLPPRNEVQHAYASHERAQETFGPLKKPVPLSEGLALMAKWAKLAGVRVGKAFENIEVEKNLPLSWQNLVVKK
ncbi:NAD-dependent epimerase/dehydratase family protein [bacterium]|nr:NAD-dependent epimerase/dehydratase family protein [bacterium]